MTLSSSLIAESRFICDLNGTEFARGIARFDSAAVRARQLPKEELVHRDDLVIL